MSITIQKLYNLLFNNNQIGLSLRMNCDSFSKIFLMSGLLKYLSVCLKLDDELTTSSTIYDKCE